MQIVLSNGTRFPCTEFGYSRLGDLLRIEVTGISLPSAFSVFSDPGATQRIQYVDDQNGNRTIEEKNGYTVIDSIRRVDEQTIRLALTRGG